MSDTATHLRWSAVLEPATVIIFAAEKVAERANGEERRGKSWLLNSFRILSPLSIRRLAWAAALLCASQRGANGRPRST